MQIMMANNMHFAWFVHLGGDSWPLLYIYMLLGMKFPKIKEKCVGYQERPESQRNKILEVRYM